MAITINNKRNPERLATMGHAKSRHARASLSLLTLLVAATNVGAADWDITPRFLMNESFSDNTELSGTNPQSDFITEVSPGLSVRGRGARVSVELDYNLQLLRYRKAEQRDSENHQLQAQISSELYKQILFLDVSSTISQQIQDNEGIVSSSNITSGSNRSEVMTYTLNPYVRHHFGPYADMESGIEMNEVFNDATTSSVSNSQSQSFQTSFTSGRRFANLPWSVNYSNREIDSDSGVTSEFKRIDAQLSYPLSRGYSLTATLGHDSNEFSSSQASTGGVSWTMGLIWTPSPRTNLEARMGDRFFGSTIFLQGSHRFKHSLFSVDYSEEIQTLNDIQTGQQLVQTTDAFGEPVFDPNASSNIALSTTSPTLQRDETTINRSLNLSFAYTRQRNSLTVSLANSLQEFQLTGDEQTTRNIKLDASRRLSRRTTGGVNGNWQVNEFSNGTRETTLFNAGMYLRHTINRYLDGNLTYSYTDRSSDTATSEFSENNLSAFFTAHF